VVKVIKCCGSQSGWKREAQTMHDRSQIMQGRSPCNARKRPNNARKKRKHSFIKDRQTDRQIERQTDRKTEANGYRQIIK